MQALTGRVATNLFAAPFLSAARPPLVSIPIPSFKPIGGRIHQARQNLHRCSVVRHEVATGQPQQCQAFP